MRCQVLLFAQLAEVVGTDRLTIELPERSTVADAVASLADDHKVIASARQTLMTAVNEHYCPPSTVLNDGDTVALVPPVSGG